MMTSAQISVRCLRRALVKPGQIAEAGEVLVVDVRLAVDLVDAGRFVLVNAADAAALAAERRRCASARAGSARAVAASRLMPASAVLFRLRVVRGATIAGRWTEPGSIVAVGSLYYACTLVKRRIAEPVDTTTVAQLAPIVANVTTRALKRARAREMARTAETHK
jgi:hypothetical protein